jgi:multiple sugar transport system ATP-binding protein
LPSIRAEVQVTEPTGPDTLVFVTSTTPRCCRLAPDVAPQVGETLTLQFDPAKVLLFDAKTGERLGTAASLPHRIGRQRGPVQRPLKQASVLD